MLTAILNFLGGGIVKQFTQPLLEAYDARLKAENDADRIEAEQRIASLQAARDIALVEASDPVSATRIGRLLIVVPYGIWWACIFAVSIINPNLGTDFVVHAIPPDINEMAKILVPAIIIADAGALTLRRYRR